MSGSDQIMLDSPAQTPEAKTQQQSVPQVGSSSSALPPPPASEIAMMIEDESTGMNNQDFSCGAAGSWNTKQWRDEYAIVTNKLLHKNFKPAHYRDPMSRPLIAKPPGLTNELDQRLRKCYEEALAGAQQRQQ